ncbi:hypothetical protein LPN01_09765 [Sphingomonas sp. A2-49]|uniref:hypothetical protein n=1 Tax=Sphingomonas sp. A2-49 TaxID=1391375 RepID=UPI0021CE0766|nr:hypothetical protein [Sphingomonas sp. A2-49]MCU6454366.1 hypothetical protein [Sphingomonas sp. A2-49]
MGRIYVLTLGDAAKRGLILEIACLRCARVIYRHPTDFLGMKTPAGREIRSHIYIEELGTMFRCRGAAGARGCGAKGARVVPRWKTELKVPAGVPLLPFLNADDRERKRMIRAARG